MLNSISNPKNLSLLLIALMVLFILPAGSAYADWPEQAKLLAADGAADDNFGHSVSISGDYAIVGARRGDGNEVGSGSAYIFTPNDIICGDWDEAAKLTAADGAGGDHFGRSVSISGDYAIVGAHCDDDNSGSAYIFKRDGASWSEQAKLTASDGYDLDYFGWSVSISGDYAVVGAYGDDDNGSTSGSAYIFKRDDLSWIEQAKLTASDGAASDEFGQSVSISGDYAIVGARLGDGNQVDSGSAYVFKKSDTPGDPNWYEQAKLIASDGAAVDNFGKSVSISGDYAIVGAYCGDGNKVYSGSAYIFKRDGTSWPQQAKLTASDGAHGDSFGRSVSVSGDYAIVGASGDHDNGIRSGSAYIFKKSDTPGDPNWYEQAKLLAADGADSDWFGDSVSVSGDYAIVGAWGDDDACPGYIYCNSGSAYIYQSFPEICGTKWHDTDGSFVKDTDETGMQGWRIYIDENENGQFDAGEPNDLTDANGNYLLRAPAAGTWLLAEENRPCWEQTYPGGDGTYTVTFEPGGYTGYNFGNARPTEIHPSAWQQDQQDKLLPADGAANDRFGISVSISGDYAIVGAQRDDDNGSESGSAYIFAPKDVDCSDWDEAAKLTASDGAADDQFGYSVSVSGAYAIVGARYNDDDGTNSGSAYIFFFDGTSWSEQTKLLASDGAAGDYFGFSVSVSGDYAIVGAYADDDNGSNSGSAYIFKRSGLSWSEQAKLTASDGDAGDYFGYSVSISGDYAIVGAFWDDDNGFDSGSAYIFYYDGTSWSQQAKLTASDGAADDWFGRSVSINGDYAIVGAYYDDDNGTDSGSAYIFQRSGTSWSQQAKLTAADGADGDLFSTSVSISGDYAIVGAFLDDDNGGNSGSAYIFKRDGTSWSQQAKLLAADGAAMDYFGNSVSSSGDYVVVGARYDDDNGSASGSAYMFGKILCPSADLTGDCIVDFKDFAEVAGQWLQGVE